MKTSIKTAAILIIGDEILSGRVKDENSPYLIDQLAKQGIKIEYCITIPDDIQIIKDTILFYSKKVTWMFTSGGIGPTHDDITIESLAEAFDVPLVENKTMLQLIHRMYGDKCTSAHLKMAELPKGIQLIPTERSNIFVLNFNNIYIFPGVPEFMRSMFGFIKDRFQGTIRAIRELNLTVDEALIVEPLNQTLEAFSEVKIGSYPSYGNQSCRVKIVMEHSDHSYLDKAADYFLEQVDLLEG